MIMSGKKKQLGGLVDESVASEKLKGDSGYSDAGKGSGFQYS